MTELKKPLTFPENNTIENNEHILVSKTEVINVLKIMKGLERHLQEALTLAAKNKA